MQNVLCPIWKLYAIRFFSSLIPAYVIERLYWEARGMSVQMVVYTEIIYASMIVILELPMGIMADRWSRTNMLRLAAAMACAEFMILLHASQFWHFALVVILAAVGRAARSGAEEAMLYDSLLQAGQSQQVEKHLGRLHALDLLGTIVAALCGGLLANHYGYSFNYWLSLGSTLVALLFTLSLREPARTWGDGERLLPIRAYWTESVRFFRDQPSVLIVILSGMITGAAVTLMDEFWQTYLDRVDIPVYAFGFFSAALFLVRMPGYLLAHRLAGVFRHRTLFTVVIASFATGFGYLWWVRDVSSLAAMLLIGLTAGITETLATGYLHHRIDSRMRATLGSFQSLGEHVTLSLVGIGFGMFAERTDIFGGFGFLSLVCGLYLIFFLVVRRKVHQAPE